MLAGRVGATGEPFWPLVSGGMASACCAGMGC